MSLSLQFSTHFYSASTMHASLMTCTFVYVFLLSSAEKREKMFSTNACEAGAARRSSASGASSLYEDFLAAQKPSASSTVDCSNSAL